MMATLILPCAMAETVKIYPSDDAFVRDRFPSQNFGVGIWEQDLRAGYNVNFGIDRSYFKFDISSVQGSVINSAVFSIDPAFSQASPVLDLSFVSSNSWSEESITWNNKPAFGSLIDSEVLTSLDRIEFSVDSSFINGNELSFVLTENGEDTDVVFESKDYYTGAPGDETRWPYLEINYDEGSCNTDADVDCNGCVEMGELLNFISEWKLGNAQMSELLNAISMWKSGQGC